MKNSSKYRVYGDWRGLLFHLINLLEVWIWLMLLVNYGCIDETESQNLYS